MNPMKKMNRRGFLTGSVIGDIALYIILFILLLAVIYRIARF